MLRESILLIHPGLGQKSSNQLRIFCSGGGNRARKAPIFLTNGKQTGRRDGVSCLLCNRVGSRHGVNPVQPVIIVARAAPASMFIFEATAVTRLSSSIVGMGQKYCPSATTQTINF